MSTMIVTMTDEQLGALMREAVKTALREFTDQAPSTPITDEERASARKRMANIVKGHRR